MVRNYVSGRHEALIVMAIGVVAAILAVSFEAFEAAFAYTQQHEDYELDELFSVVFFLGLAYIAISIRRTIQLRREIKNREAAEAEAHKLARHDILTGLPNRRLFSEAVTLALAQSSADNPCAVLLIDLDRFKPVNDVYGHALGDAVLRVVAERLRSVAPASDTVARIGGDEFAAVLRLEDGTEAPIRLAQRILNVLKQPMVFAELKVDIGASVGIALYPDDGSDADDLLRAADIAMYRAKRGGRNTFAFFESSMDAELRARAELERDLKLAVARGEIRPHYQPIVALPGGRLLGLEILARWYHPTKGVLAPDVFIPMAEDIGLIGELTYGVLRQACNEAKSWPPYLTLALNVSPAQLQDRMLPAMLLGILTETGFAAGRLEIEVTENALVADLNAAKTILTSLQNVGVKIALDDFGTGYSSLYHLRELNFDKMKIDRSFVQAIDDPESAKIVKAVLGLGKSLGLPTTAEGIESPEHMHQLIQLGCEFGQGYLFGKAVPGAEVSGLIEKDTAATAAPEYRAAAG